jgi:hypothetical protein
MATITDVKLVDEGSAAAFEAAVMDLINQGYQPLGEPFNTGSPSIGARFCLMMINGSIKVTTATVSAGAQTVAFSPQAIAATNGATITLQGSGGVLSFYVLTMGAGIASLTLPFAGGAALDDSSSPVLMFSSQQAVASVSFAGGDATGGGLPNPTSLAAGFMYIYAWDDVNARWMRIQ